MLTLFTTTIVALMTIHWLADFVLQSRWMAVNKGSSLKALLLHVTVYTLVLGFGVFLLAFWIIGGATSPGVIEGSVRFAVVYALLNGILHGVVDFITSKMSSALYKSQDYYEFWVVIGFDQLLHTSILVLSYFWLLSV